MNRKNILAAIILLATTHISIAGTPLGTAFTYQGQLKSGGAPYTGTADIQFTLYDAATLGNVVAGPIASGNVQVVSGLFTTTVDFGSTAFNGEARWLQIAVVTPAGGGSYIPLTPRQAVTPTPYALALPGLRTSQNGVSPSIIGGHGENSVSSGILSATVSGGGNTDGPNRATDHYSTVSGGEDNQAGNGDTNLMNSGWSTVAGGIHNIAGGMYSVVSGGIQNTASGDLATAVGGYGNTASGYLGTTLGGTYNTAQGQNSTAAGSYARALHDGCFVWGDASVPFMTWFDSTNPNQFLIRAAGGVGINTTSPTSALTVQGMIESQSEGFKFPDGTIQTTAAGGGGEGLSLPYDGTTASSVPAFSATNTSGSVAIRGLAANPGGGINYGGYFEAYGNEGRAVAGAVASSNGFAGYFQGRGYFSDNVGIGTDTPGGRLDVRGGDLIVDSSTGGLRIGHGGTGDGWSFATGDGGQTLLLEERPGGASGDMRIAVKSGGNVGIGTNAPSQKLHVAGDATRILVDAITGSPEINLKNPTGLTWGIYNHGTENYLAFYRAGNRMVISQDGKVGIGSSSPTAMLDVTGAPASLPAISATHTGAMSDEPAILGTHGPTGLWGVGVKGAGGATGVEAEGGTTGLKAVGGTTGIRAEGGHGGVEAVVESNGNGMLVYTGVKGVVSGGSAYNCGVLGDASGGGTNRGVYGIASGGTTNYGVYGTTLSDPGSYAGYFEGHVHVAGTLSKAGGSFKIDHPLDPENKYLQHSFVESPDMKNIYDGVVTTDAKGYATVTLPDWFEALNKDFRYQLTCIGQFAQAIVAQEIQHGQFTIQTDKPTMKVSWQVTGIRKDAWAEANRIEVEMTKRETDRGMYLHPGLYGAPAEKQIGRIPELSKPRAGDAGEIEQPSEHAKDLR